MPTVQKITPFLWFDDHAEEAARHYVRIFKQRSKIGRISRYSEAGQEHHRRPPGSVMVVEFTLVGQHFSALNGGPIFPFTEAVSFQVNCDTQKEVDYFWNELSAGGDPRAHQCGWLKDRFGLSWQVVPTILQKMIIAKDQRKAQRAMQAMMGMKKLDIAALKKAYAGK